MYIESKSSGINPYFSEKPEFGFEITHTKSQTNFSGKVDVKKERVVDEKGKRVKLTLDLRNGPKPVKLFINSSGGRNKYRVDF